MKPRTRDECLNEIADNVRALTVGVRTTTPVDRAAGQGEDGIRRRSVEQITWRLDHPALLLQLTAALIPGRGARNVQGKRGKPAPKAPSATAAAATLDDITNGWETGPKGHRQWQTGVLDLQLKMRRAARRGGSPRRPLTRALEDIRALAHVLPDPWAADAATATRAWVGLARTTLALDAPVATLRDVGCPHCGTRLKVRSDASSDVWCPNPACRDIDGNRHRWARPEWPFLLEQLARGEIGEGAA